MAETQRVKEKPAALREVAFGSDEATARYPRRGSVQRRM
jgi:hypothetical protein